jgi:ribonuclease HI
MVTDPHAMYVFCDGAMDYDSNNSGGIGYLIVFPDCTGLDPIPISKGTYKGGNIERLELEALIQALKEVLDIFKKKGRLLYNINQIIFVTDRFGLCDSEKTNVYKIQKWKSQDWKNFEGKPIKNHKLLDELDKTRKKLSVLARARVNIEFRPRKQNKPADKLAKKGKSEGLLIDKLAKKGEKIGKRKFEGAEIKYSKLSKDNELHINVFRKDPVQKEWEVWVEICNGLFMGSKLKIYADDRLATKLQRGNEFIVRVKNVLTHHISIYRTIKKKKQST